MILPHINIDETSHFKYAILPGAPERVDRIGEVVRECGGETESISFNREYKSLRLRYKGVEMIAISTGMGGPSAAIGLEELKRLGVTHAIRIGSCGALQDDLAVGQLVIVQEAAREEGTSFHYIAKEEKALADPKLLQAVEEAAKENNFPYQVGLARSHDALYADDKNAKNEYWSNKGALGSDMETAALYAVGKVRHVACASILNVVVGYHQDLQKQIGNYVSGEEAAAQGEKNEILTALDALIKIEKNL